MKRDRLFLRDVLSIIIEYHRYKYTAKRACTSVHAFFVQLYGKLVKFISRLYNMVLKEVITLKMREEYTCPLELVHDMIKGKWKPIILWRLRLGATSLAKLEKDIDGIPTFSLPFKIKNEPKNTLSFALD